MEYRMKFVRYQHSAYIARDNDKFGITVWGADLHHLELVMGRVHPDLRNDVLSCFYSKMAATLPTPPINPPRAV